MADVEHRIRQYITENFFLDGGQAALHNDDSFLEKGIIDSTGVLELVNWMEETFGFEVDDTELIPDNLDSIGRLVVFIERKCAKP
jgi:acyl carrier protein